MSDRFAWRALLLVALALPSGAARAGGDDDPDEEIARRRFAAGAAFYEKSAYPQALKEFEAARRLKPLPELDYNIARCLDRMERPVEALAAYERYITAKPSAADATKIRDRIAVLRERAPAASEAPPVAKLKLDQTRWTITSTIDKSAATYRFLPHGKLTVQPSTGKARACQWRQVEGTLVTECGVERVSWIVGRDEMHGQSALGGWNARRAR